MSQKVLICGKAATSERKGEVIMGFWIFMFCMVVLTPVLMMIFGAVFVKYPPEDINNVYGYRTRRSMKDQQIWDFAQRHWGKCAFYTGLAGLMTAVPCMLPCLGGSVDAVGIWGGVVCTVVAAAVIGAPIFLTERELKRLYF